MVAPLAGAWIEMIKCVTIIQKHTVAPLAGAWIEMSDAILQEEIIDRRSPCGSVD